MSLSFNPRRLLMNPSQNTPVPALSQHFNHAGGWGKLGWQTVEVEQDIGDDALSTDDGDARLFC